MLALDETNGSLDIYMQGPPCSSARTLRQQAVKGCARVQPGGGGQVMPGPAELCFPEQRTPLSNDVLVLPSLLWGFLLQCMRGSVVSGGSVGDVLLLCSSGRSVV
jgi:hypothetical protein